MRRAFFLLVLLTAVLVWGNVACRDDGNELAVATIPPTNATNTQTPIPEATDTQIPPSATPSPTATATIIPSPTPQPPELSLAETDVSLYPVPQLFAGDKATFQVRASVPPMINAEEVVVRVWVNETAVGSSTLSGRNLSGDAVGILKWVWDTTNQVGKHQVRVTLDPDDAIQVGDENPDNNQVSFTVSVYDRALLPADEANAAWVTAETNCCQVHVVSGTAAYRDLPELLPAVETAVQEAASTLSVPIGQKYDIYFIDRVIGQGGYAGSAMVVSYLDRDYVGNILHQVIVHEAVHVLDRQIAPQRIAFLAEGVAVWASGGHYKPEDLDQRSAALLQLNYYIPLADLLNDFYPVQHEIGYLQAAGFVSYLVDNYGWMRFRDFYGDVTLDDAPTAAEALDKNLQIYYNKTLAEMEAEWQAYLSKVPTERTAVLDLQATVRYYNIMRRYQTLYDPTAYFLNAWIPYPNEVQESGNPADLTRHPQEGLNVTLEVMLQAANDAMLEGSYDRAKVILDSVERVLDNNGTFMDPLATNYWQIVQQAASEGYEVHQVDLENNEAAVLATRNSDELIELRLALQDAEWILIN